MTISRQEYMAAVRDLTAKKIRLAFLRHEAEQENQDEQILRLTESLTEAENQFWLETAEFIPLVYLCRILGLEAFGRHCLLLALGYELNPHMAKQCAYLHEDAEQDFITLWLAQLTWHQSLELPELIEIFAEDGFLRFVFQSDHRPTAFIWQRLQLRPRIRSFLFWQLTADQQLKRILNRWPPDQKPAPLHQKQPDITKLLSPEIKVVELCGAVGSGRRFCAKSACAKLGRMACQIWLEEILKAREPPEQMAAEVVLECVILQAVPILLMPADVRQGWIRDLIDQLLSVSDFIIVISRKRIPDEVYGDTKARLVLEVSDLSLLEKREVWRREGMKYPVADTIDLPAMANVFHFTGGKIKEALRQAYFDAKSRGKEVVDKKSLQNGCYSLMEEHMGSMAVKVPVVYEWDDLVLPSLQKETIQIACNQVKYKHKVYEQWGFQHKMPYGRGISLVFAGPPGTGKTMAAQVFAAELGLDLYKVELSAVVSKYVGETEKNLNAIFEQARQSQIILLFDEADVLFSKRTAVKDANDKYSNMEAAFLLQKMEAYDGVTILSTNLLQNFDEAFKRRIKFVIDFPFPDQKQRRALWERSLPTEMPVGELDFEYLAANFELTGSNIHNIMLHAAFLAAPTDEKLGMREILAAVKNEFAKSGKHLTREELGEYHMLLPKLR